MKAALAMYSNQKQPVIVSSKRNTTYLVPTGVHNENPFPVDHIAGGKLVDTSNLSSGKDKSFGYFGRPLEVLINSMIKDEETSDEELNEIIESGNKETTKNGLNDRTNSMNLNSDPKSSPSNNNESIKADLNHINDYLNANGRPKISTEFEDILNSPKKTPKRVSKATDDEVNIYSQIKMA